MAWSRSRWLMRGAVLIALAVPLGGCALLGGGWTSHAMPDDPQSPTPGSPRVSATATPSIVHCLVLGIEAADGTTVDETTLTALRAIIALRLEWLGADGAAVTAAGDDSLVVGLPDGDVEGWRTAMTRPGVLALVPIPPAFDSQVIDGAPLPPRLEATPLLSHADIASAGVASDELGRPAVDLQLTDTGAAVFDAWAADNVGQRLAIVLDGEVVSAPVINTTRFNGRAQISGNFSASEAAQIATALGTGPLPALVSIVSTADVIDGRCPS